MQFQKACVESMRYLSFYVDFGGNIAGKYFN